MCKKCAIRELEDRPGDKPNHTHQASYNFTENFGWLGRKTFASRKEAEKWVNEKGLEVVEEENS